MCNVSFVPHNKTKVLTLLKKTLKQVYSIQTTKGDKIKTLSELVEEENKRSGHQQIFLESSA